MQPSLQPGVRAQLRLYLLLLLAMLSEVWLLRRSAALSGTGKSVTQRTADANDCNGAPVKKLSVGSDVFLLVLCEGERS